MLVYPHTNKLLVNPVFKPLSSISNAGQKQLSDKMQGRKGEGTANKS